MAGDAIKKITLYQGKIGGGVPHDDLREIQDFEPDFTLLPEYFWVKNGIPDHQSAAGEFGSIIEYISELSGHIPGYLVAGTVVEPDNGTLYNTCFIYKNGDYKAKHRKVHLYGRERDILTPGDGFSIFNLDGTDCSVIICADALNPSTFSDIRKLNARIIFAPTYSIVKEADKPGDKLTRDKEIFLRGAELSGAVLCKCCSVGTLFGHPANGRSIICSPGGFIYRGDEEDEQNVKIIKVEIDLKRKKGWMENITTR
ncbi:MAG: hypothetical protein GF307_02885 [candidate division Zixibacteria bacterium]|nr:hypothetical protein [candidate division Zixibacteria bacterium]